MTQASSNGTEFSPLEEEFFNVLATQGDEAAYRTEWGRMLRDRSRRNGTAQKPSANGAAGRGEEVSSHTDSWPDPPGVEAYHGLAGTVVRVLEPSTEADPVGLLVQLQVAFGNAIGRRAHFNAEGDKHFGNEFAVLVGRTSKSRKGSSWGRIRQVNVGADIEWVQDCITSGLSSGEGLVHEVRDEVKSSKGETTDEGVVDKRRLVLESEFSSVLKSMDRQGNVLSGILRQAWDNGDIGTLTKQSRTKATGAHISLIGHITIEECRRYLNETEAANGLGNRHLWVCVRRSKVLPEGGSLDGGALGDLQGELAAAIEFGKEVDLVCRDSEARELWAERYEKLSEGQPALAGCLLARGEAHVMRLAMLYALLDRSGKITRPHLEAAFALWDYCERSVRFIFGAALGDTVADAILRGLRNRPAGMTRRDIHEMFSGHQKASRIDMALGLLAQMGLVDCVEEKTAGRTAERWKARLGAT